MRRKPLVPHHGNALIKVTEVIDSANNTVPAHSVGLLNQSVRLTPPYMNSILIHTGLNVNTPAGGVVITRALSCGIAENIHRTCK